MGTEHLPLGLLGQGEGVTACALSSLHVILNEACEQIECILGHGRRGKVGQAQFTLHLKSVLRFGIWEALQLGHNYIGTEQIL